MANSKELREDKRKTLYLQFRIPTDLLEQVEKVHEAEQQAMMMPIARSKVLVKLLWLGIAERKRNLSYMTKGAK